MRASINIILLGQSGSGKSSLANYLYQQQIFRIGDGAPVTRFEDEIGNASIEKDDYTINVFDIPGLEPDNYERWKSKVGTFVQERSSFDKEPSRWIHGAFYVINAASDRVQYAEIDIIKNFPLEFQFPISVVFTNCDSVNDTKLQQMANPLIKELPGIQIFKVCSVERNKRGGRHIKPFGREQLLKGHGEKVAFCFEQRMGIQFFDTIVPNITRLYFGRVKKKIEESDLSFFSVLRNIESLDKIIDIEKLEKELQGHTHIKAFEDFVQKLDMYVEAMGFSSDLHAKWGKLLDDELDSAMGYIAPSIKEITNNLESESTWDNVVGAKNALVFLISIKKNICTIIDNMEAFMLQKSREENEKCRKKLADPRAFHTYAHSGQE